MSLVLLSGNSQLFAACTNLNLSFTNPAPTGCGVPKTLVFDNTSTGTISNSSSYIWKINGVRVDSTFGTAPNFSYTFLSPGTYTVRMVGRTPGGCLDSIQQSVTIVSATPQVFDGSGALSFIPRWNNCIINPLQNNNFNISISSNAILNNYTIIWGDNTADNSGASLPIGSSVAHTYTTLGLFTVKIVTVNAGCSDTLTGTVVNMRPVSTAIKPLPPGQLAGCAPHTITFQDTTEFALPGTILTWNFGDGTVITRDWTQANSPISHTYQKQASQQCVFTVSLSAFNPNCNTGPNNASTYTISPILIFDEDVAQINPPANLCEPSLTYTFGNSSQDNCITGTRYYYWDFGDGTNTGWITSKAAQTHTFPSLGTYTLMLIDSNGCGSDTTFATVTFNAPPNVGFTVSPKTGCAPLVVNIADTSTGIGNTRFWTLLGTTPNSSTAATLSRTYTNPGTYVVRLSVSNVCANNIIRTDTIRVYAKPVVQIGNATSGCVPHTLQLQNNTTNQSPTATYFWDFGNGQTSTLQNPPSTVYNSTGNFTIKLVVTDSCGKDSQLVNIAVSTLPVASFTVDSVCRGLATTFSSTSILAPGDIVSSYRWYYGNGDSTASGASPQTYTYASDGTFNAVLQITTDKNCVHRDTVQVKVKASPLLSIANNPVNICNGNVVTFDGTATTTAPSVITSYRWTFGTADTARVEDTVYRFPSAGNYTVSYTASNNAGCTNTTTKPITVHPNPDSRFFKNAACTGQRVQFRDSSTVIGAGNSITQWAWDFDNNGVIDSTTQHPYFVFTSFGLFRSKLTVTTNNGCSNTDSLNTQVNITPTVGLSSSAPALCKGDTFSFFNTSLGAFAYEWRFGDGSGEFFETTTLPYKYSYSDTGTFTVKLIAFSLQGCKDSTTTQVISRPLPVASFVVNDSIGCAPKQFTFNNTSILSNGYKWLVNDSETSTALNRPDTLVSLSGQVINIKLIATNQFNCRPDTAVRTLYTFSNPTPDFTLSADSGCGPLSVTFTNTTPNGVNYTWNLGNGNTVFTQHSASTYLPSLINDSIYNIKLIASNGPGCSDSITKQVRVFPQPLSSFTHATSSGCGPLGVTFANTSQHHFGGNFSDMTFDWNFGNSSTSSVQHPSATFNASAVRDTSYNIRLIAFSRYGCSDTSTSSVKVFPDATANFTVNQPAGCGPHSTAFTNLSTPNDTGSISIMSFAWNFSNGGTSVQTTPSSIFTASQSADTIYNVRLIAFSEHGCADTAFRQVRVYPNPKAVFTPDVTSGCAPFNVNFINQSFPNDTGTINDMTFMWHLGNGFGSLSRNAFSQYTANIFTDTVYTIKLTAISEHGCLDSTSRQVTVHPKPITSFTVNRTTGCGPLPVQFTNTTQLGSVYYWNFNDGDTSNQVNPTHTFESYDMFDSIYEVKLTAQSQFGCLGDTVKTLIIARYDPVADFFASQDSICGSGNVAFFNASLGGVTNAWNFANGQTSTAINPALGFTTTPGKDTTYMIRLVVSSPYGCKDTVIKPLKVNALPEALFSLVPPGCTPHPVTFNNTSLRGASFHWDFGDATSDTTPGPTKIFDNNVALVNRIYPVTLTAISSSGCIDTVKQNIVVYPLPFANFTSNKSLRCDTSEYTFVNSSQGALSYQWQFGDGSTSTGTSPVHYFRTLPSQDTTYHVKLIATTNNGCKDSIQKSVVTHPLVTANFNALVTSACGNLNAQFTNQSANAVNYYWEFGDGAGSNQLSPSYRYMLSGTYPVKLTAYDQYGCSDTAERPGYINIFDIPEAEFFFTPLQPRMPLSLVTFRDSSRIASGTITHSWDFGDPASLLNNVSLLQHPLHVYTDSGNYDTRLILTSNNGCKDTLVKQVRVLPHLPVPNFTYVPDKGCRPLTVTFTNTSQFATSYSWDFGDGAKSTDTNPVHVYVNEGKYTVKLIATGPGGSAEMRKDTIITVYPLPVVNFTASKSQRCDTTEYFMLNSTQGASTYLWTFGDNTTSNALSPTHYYNTLPSTDIAYTIKLVATTSFGCKDSSEKTIVVHPLVIAQLSSLVRNSCQNLDVQFANNSVNAMSYFWLFGDGGGSNAETPSHKYNNTGAYTVTLIAYDQYGCTDTTSEVNFINIFEIPKALFSFNPVDPQLPDATVNFTDLSFISTGTLSYEWDFGDPASGSNTSLNQHPVHQYSDSGNFTPRLVVTSNNGCRDTTSKALRVAPRKPIAAFTHTPYRGCKPLVVSFTNQSQYAYTYRWDFGDGTRSTEVNPVHVYDRDDSYTIELTAYGPGGDSTIQKFDTVTVYDTPRARFSANPNMIHLPQATSVFTNTSFDATRAFWTLFDPSGAPVFNDTNFHSSYTFTQAGNYAIRLVVMNQYECTDTSYLPDIVTVDNGGAIHVPNIFTPNGDGSNETFKPIATGVRRADYLFKIYDRWGKLVFETTDPDKAWDGKVSGGPAVTETYVWIVEGTFVTDERFVKKGTVTLLR